MPDKQRLIAGAMSGTSADGVEIAITRITGHALEMHAQLLAHYHDDYRPQLKQQIFTLRCEGKVALAELARVGREISLAYATAVNDAIKSANLESHDISDRK